MTERIDIDIIEVLVTGIPASGKSSFMQTLNPELISEDGWNLVDIALDDELYLRFAEPPAQSEFDYMWLREIISTVEVDGFVVVCDSSRPALFGEVIGVMQTVVAFHPGAACIVVANKQDHPQAWSAEDIRFGLNIPQSIPVVPCVASQLDLVRDAVVELLTQIFGSDQEP